MKRRTARKRSKRAIHEWRKSQKRVRDRHDFGWRGVTLRVAFRGMILIDTALHGILEAK